MPIFVTRGEIWIVDFEPGAAGHEQGGEPRPAVIVSSSALDPNLTGMLIVVPSTRTRMPRTGELVPSHYQIEPNPKNGLSARSYFMCEQVRSISIKRLGSKLGKLSSDDLYEIEDRLIMLMDLGTEN